MDEKLHTVLAKLAETGDIRGVVSAKLSEIERARELERVLKLSEFQAGQLSGAEQTLSWLVRGHMEPVRAILYDEQLDQLGNLCDEPRCVERATWIFVEEGREAAQLCDEHIGPWVNVAQRPYTHEQIK